jgi:hypothetical protein
MIMLGARERRPHDRDQSGGGPRTRSDARKGGVCVAGDGLATWAMRLIRRKLPLTVCAIRPRTANGDAISGSSSFTSYGAAPPVANARKS